MTTAAENNDAIPAPENHNRPEGGSYDILRARLAAGAKQLRDRLDGLDVLRRETFGGVQTELVATERIATANNCIPRDMAPVGDCFLFGFNVQLHLRSETRPEDVFGSFRVADGQLKETALSELIDGDVFRRDFADLYKYYKAAAFQKFSVRGPYLYALFRVGHSVADVKGFKWLRRDGCALEYVDNRSAHEVVLPPQHEFEWKRATRDMHRPGKFAHISIADRIFIETTGGDLTIKIEDNTETGEGIYAEPVEHADQTLDDAEIHFALVGNLIVLRVKPYQEQRARYIVYSEKIHQARRIDAIKQSCVQLPEDHGLIFPNGYFLQTGDYKEFDFPADGFEFRRRIVSPNGEDTLFVFHNPVDGRYVLLFYNLIARKCESPIVGHGFSLFEDGTLYSLRAQEEPQKIHTIQHWITPCHAPGHEPPPALDDSPLTRFGNREVVRALASARALAALADRGDAYDGLYVDLVHEATNLLDAFPWLAEPACGAVDEPVRTLREAAQAAIAEFEKVTRLRRRAATAQADAARETEELLAALSREVRKTADDHVRALDRLRLRRGELLALRDTPYISVAALDALETRIVAASDAVANACAELLSQPEALADYHLRAESLREAAAACEKAADAKALESDADTCARDLELLLDTVNSLKIDDATVRTAILDGLSSAQAALASARAAVRNRRRDLGETEGRAEFAAQLRVIAASVANALDSCDTPERCEEQLARLHVQLEEVEGRFGEFEDFAAEVQTRREEIESAFAARRLQLVEARNRKAEALHRSADRILKGVRAKAETIDDPAALLAHFAGDAMVAKARQLAEQLRVLGDAVKAEDIETRLKNLNADSLRQLRDRQDLHADGPGLVRFGTHQFQVNRQPFDVTFVRRDDRYCLHLTGTGFFEPCDDAEIVAARDLWERESPAESPEVYRGEFLAFSLFAALGTAPWPTLDAAARWTPDEWLPTLRAFMEPRYEEGYVKGVHDRDAALILVALCDLSTRLGLLRHDASARALGRLAWHHLDHGRQKALAAFAQACGQADRALRSARAAQSAQAAEEEEATRFIPQRFPQRLLTRLREPLAAFADAAAGWTAPDIERAAAYLAEWLASSAAPAPQRHPTGAAAYELAEAMKRTLGDRWKEVDAALAGVRADPAAALATARSWIKAFLDDETPAIVEARPVPNGSDGPVAPSAARDALSPGESAVLEETAALLVLGAEESPGPAATVELSGLAGEHPRIREGRLALDYGEFMRRLSRHVREDAPRFAAFRARKTHLAEQARIELRADELKPKSLSSFVRNRLIDTVYLPLIGDNLAKQLGAAGKDKRADRMGLLLLISPPGYGKTTLMEYIAARLGLAFMKIDGPALGHGVTSLDPAEAPNATAREELRRLALALEMGDNVMLYLDDIQHCNPELLQKFIPLCDAQRKIEAVHKDRPKTYDLRGRRFCVVMAGNPYTESGRAFRIPDMLANRADTYNLGDILGGHEEAFRLSYLENAMGSNRALQPLAARDRADILALIREAEGGPPAELAGAVTPDERADWLAILTKLVMVREVVLAVNQAYIASAAQADEYRREPPFKLQGSYRNMGRITEKVLPLMNDAELETVVTSHYEQEAQTLAADAEANLLKFRDLRGILTPEQADRWDEIKGGFLRNNALRGADENDRLAQAVMRLGALQGAVESVAAALGGGGGGRETKIALSERTLDRLRVSLAETLAAPLAEAVRRHAGEAVRLAPEVMERFETLLAEPHTWALDDGTGKRLDEFLNALAMRPNTMTLAPAGLEAMAATLAERFAAIGETFRAALPDKKVYQVRLPSGTLKVIETQHAQLQAFIRALASSRDLPEELKRNLTAEMRSVAVAYNQFYEQIRESRHNQNEPITMD